MTLWHNSQNIRIRFEGVRLPLVPGIVHTRIVNTANVPVQSVRGQSRCRTRSRKFHCSAGPHVDKKIRGRKFRNPGNAPSALLDIVEIRPPKTVDALMKLTGRWVWTVENQLQSNKP